MFFLTFSFDLHIGNIVLNNTKVFDEISRGMFTQ